MRVHVVQLAYGDDEPVADRVERVAGLVREQRGADLVVLPELWAAGRLRLPAVGRARRARGRADRRAPSPRPPPQIGAVVHAGSVRRDAPWRTAPTAARRAAACGTPRCVLGPDGGVLATYRKIHRFGFGTGEPRLLEAGQDVVTVPAPAALRQPVAGLATCYDLRFPELFRAAAGRRRAALPRAGRLARRPGRALDACSAGRGRWRTRSCSSPATPRAPTPGPRWAGAARSSPAVRRGARGGR